MRRLDVRRIHKAGLLVPGASFIWQWLRGEEQIAYINIRAEEERLVFAYRVRNNGGPWQDMEYPVSLDWTACHLGGQRPWFICPASGCGRRVAILYGGTVFACRHCHNLAYTCQREAAHDRLLGRALKIRARLGWEGEYGSKPKGMHWRTFERLEEEHYRFNALQWMAIAEKFGIGLGG
jgi:hypothetical protein